MASKQYLTANVHRLEDGGLKTYAPGDVAPDWVKNPKILTDKAPGAPEPEDAGQTPPPATPSGQSDAATNDDLDLMDGKALKEIAGQLGVAKNGSHAAIRDRIRAKRAEQTPDPVAAAGTAGTEDAERAALIASLREQGVEVEDDVTEAELQVLAEAQE